MATMEGCDQCRWVPLKTSITTLNTTSAATMEKGRKSSREDNDGLPPQHRRHQQVGDGFHDGLLPQCRGRQQVGDGFCGTGDDDKWLTRRRQWPLHQQTMTTPQFCCLSRRLHYFHMLIGDDSSSIIRHLWGKTNHFIWWSVLPSTTTRKTQGREPGRQRYRWPAIWSISDFRRGTKNTKK